MKPWILTVIALILGLSIAWVDTRPTWDDTGVTAGAIFIVTAFLSGASPSRAWLWVLLVSVWIPLHDIALHGHYASLLAVAVAVAGSAVGVFGRKVFTAAVGPDSTRTPQA